MAKDYLKKMQYAIEKGNATKALSIIQQALVEDLEDEKTCANLIIIGHTFGLPVFEFIQQFLGTYPNSLYPLRVFLAKMMCDSDNFDDATSEARYFLRIVQENGKIGQIEDEKLLEYTMQAFLLTTTVYVFVGARSYAKRVITWAKEFANEQWQKNFDIELSNLEKELAEEHLKEQDEKWEAFFQNMENYDELYQRTAENRFTELAIRLRILKEEKEKNEMQPIDRREITRVVMVDEKGDYLLG